MIIIAVLGSIVTLGLINRSVLELHTQHDRNPLFVMTSDGNIRNGYTVKILNKTHQDREYTLTIEGIDLNDIQIEAAGHISLDKIPVFADSVGHYRLYLSADKQKEARKNITFKKPVMAGALALMMASSIMINTKNNTLVARAMKPAYWQMSKEEKAVHEALKLIPENATVHTQSTISNHLSNRDYIKAFPRGLKVTGEHASKHNFYNYDRNVNRERSDVEFKHEMDFYAQEPEYALVSPKIIAYPMRNAEDVKYWIEVLSENHNLVYQKHEVYLFRRQDTQAVIESPHNN